MTVAAQTGERETMVIDLAEHRLNRQLRSAFTMPGPWKPGPFDASVVLTWRKVSPSAHLMVDPRNGARAVIRDTGADAGRFLWSVRVRWTLYRKVAPMIWHEPSSLLRRPSALLPITEPRISDRFLECENQVCYINRRTARLAPLGERPSRVPRAKRLAQPTSWVAERCGPLR